MITAAAPAPPDSRALPPATAGAAPSSSQAPSTFESVYRNLPALPGDSDATAGSQLPNAKELAGKKHSAQGPDDNLPAIAALSLSTDLPPQRTWTPAPPTLSLTARASTTEPRADLPAPATTPDLAAPASSSRSLAISDPAGRADNLRDASEVSGNPPIALAAALQQSTAFQETTPLRAGATKPDKSSMTTAGMATISRQLASVRGPSLHPQDLAGAPLLSAVASQPAAQPRNPRNIAVPDAREHAEIPARDSATRVSGQPGADPAVIAKGLADSIVPRSQNLAFSLRMREADSLKNRTPGAPPQQPPVRTQPANQTKDEERPPASPAAAPAATRAPSPAIMPGTLPTGSVNLLWSEASPHPGFDAIQNVQLPEPLAPATTAVAEMHAAQPVLPETHRPNATGEILLQLGSKDQSAAIRVSDRAGAVNVSVHAADPELRSSLRSNLGELASQLTHQGWKTDLLKPGVAPTRGDTSHNAREDGQRSSSQGQPFANGERQSHRDRRANGGQWLAEFEEQASGNSSNPGGTN